MTTVVSEAPGAGPGTPSWVSLAQDVADGVVCPWAAAGSLGSWSDEELLALPSEDAVAVLDLSRRLAAAAEAVQLLAIEALARRDEDTVDEMEDRWQREQRARGAAGGSSPRGVLTPEEWTVSTVQPVMRLSPTATQSLVSDARTLVGSLPETFALVRAGRLSVYHARLVGTQARCVDVDKRGELDAVLVHPELGRRRYRIRLPELTSPAVRARVAQVATDVDPDWVRRHVRTAREGRHVRVRAGLEPGVSSWSASLPSEDSLAMWAAIDALADELLRADETAAGSLIRDPGEAGHGAASAQPDDGTRPHRRGIEAARADALVALVLGQATVTTTVDLTVPLTDWPTAEPAEDTSTTEDAAPTEATSTAEAAGVTADAVPPDGPRAEESLAEAGRTPRSLRPSRVEHVLDGVARPALETRLKDLLRGLDEEVVDGVHIVHARGHLQLLVDRPRRTGRTGATPDTSAPPATGQTSPEGAASPPPPVAPSTPSSAPALPSVLPWVVGVEHPRVGVLLPEAVVRLLADPDTRIRLHGCHPDTGTLTTHDPTTYRPGAALARAVRARDGHCRFPGCTTPASRCQLDHVRPFPAGPTTAANLATLCTGHHRLKTHTPWRYVLHDDGTCTWTSPAGHTYDTHPDRPTDRAA